MEIKQFMKYISFVTILFFFITGHAQTVQTSILNETRTYEVTAILLPNNKILAVWMEARPDREISSQGGNMRVAYKISSDLGENWSHKKIIDNPNTLLKGNPDVITDNNGNIYLILMSVNTNFFSGNLSFYEWKKEQNEFKLKSIPASSENSLLDKPGITICGNHLYLAYVEYSKMLDKGLLKIQSSSDGGMTWSNPKEVHPKNEVIALGPSITCLNEKLILAFGSYWRNSIYFTKKNSQNILNDFPTPKVISEISDTLVSAMTVLATNKNNKIAIGWEYIHQPNEIYISLSRNNGKSWTEPNLISKSGNMLSMTFDKNKNLHLIYDKFNEDEFSVIYERLSLLTGNSESKMYLSQPSKIPGTRDYIGAFQKIIISNDGTILTFWINFSEDNKLYFSKWNGSK